MIRRPAKKPIKKTLTFDQLYAGVSSDSRCTCGGKASEHVVTMHRTTSNSIACDHCYGCKTFNNGWGKS